MRALWRCLRRKRKNSRDAGEPHTMPPLGIMVEVPSVAIAPELFTNVAFFSIGSNDLTQYVMAAARDNTAVAKLNSVTNPAVLRLIAAVAGFGRLRRHPGQPLRRRRRRSNGHPSPSQGRPARPLRRARTTGARQGGHRRRHGLDYGQEGRPRSGGCRGRDPRLQERAVDRHRAASIGYAPTACRRARQAPQLRHADHQPDLFDADPVEAPAGDFLRLPFQHAGARRRFSPPIASHIRARHRLTESCAVRAISR